MHLELSTLDHSDLINILRLKQRSNRVQTSGGKNNTTQKEKKKKKQKHGKAQQKKL